MNIYNIFCLFITIYTLNLFLPTYIVLLIKLFFCLSKLEYVLVNDYLISEGSLCANLVI